MSRRTASRTPAKSGASATEAARAPAARRGATGSVLGARRRAGGGRAARARRGRGIGLRARLRRVPRAAWVCALVAFVNAACWSVISPPFEVPDEPSHFAYVQRLAETGRLPSSSEEKFPPAEYAVLKDLHYKDIRFHPEEGTISTQTEQRTLERDLARSLARTGAEGGAGVAASQPPLYYALKTIPYGLASFGTLLDRVALMRLLSALMGGLTALFAYLFLREALPGARWAWTVGGLGVALAPLLGLMSGAVNPDALLFAVSATLFYCLARGFRRGLTPKLAAATGAVLTIGLLTKLNFIGLVPGAILGLAVLCVREARISRRAAHRSLALAAAFGAGPIAVYVIFELLSGRAGVEVISGALTLNGRSGSIFKEISYIWQFYLPRLPGMSSYFHGFLTTRVFWFDGLVGLYGWVDTTFPDWVYNAALVPAGLIAALFARALFTCREALRGRLIELAVYLTIGLGVLVPIGVDDYIHHMPGEYVEPRYLLPLLALWGAVLALAARGAGRRWGPVAGVLIVTLALAHDIFSQLLVISRYYG